MQFDLNRYRETFFEEAADHLAELEAGLLEMEGAGQDRELLNKVFRAAHSIKGAAGTLGLDEIGAFTHALESLLDRMRGGEVPITPARIDLLLRARDILAGLLAAARVQGAPPPATATVLEQLRQSQSVILSPAQATAPSEPPLRVYAIHFSPNPTVFLRGFEPLLLFRELENLGEIIEIVADCKAFSIAKTSK